MKEYPIYTAISPVGEPLLFTSALWETGSTIMLEDRTNRSWDELEKEGYTIASGYLQLNTEEKE